VRPTAAQAAATQAPTPQYAITPQDAANIALAASPGAVLRATPELVSFQATVAYEVHLDRGLIYVDATTGKVLYNGAPVPQPQAHNASSNHSPSSGGKPSGGGDDKGGGDD